MRRVDLLLLKRVASRLETLATARYDSVPDDKKPDAKRVRDTELGDVRDLREFIKSGEVVETGSVIVPLELDAERLQKLDAALAAVAPQPGVDPVAIGRQLWADLVKIARGEA